MRETTRNIVIAGAGIAGISLAKELQTKHGIYAVSAFIDDNPEKIGTEILGIPVQGPIAQALRTMPDCHTKELIIAIPSAEKELIQSIYDHGSARGFRKIHVVPSVSTIIEGDAHFAQIREIKAEDILGRKPAPLNIAQTMHAFAGKRILITGAGGSIGSELCRQLLEAGAERLYLFGHGENSIYHIDKELRELQNGGVGLRTTIIPVIGELRDRAYMTSIMKKLSVSSVFHAAAYKHVPLMELNPVIAVENNILGTKNLLDASEKAGVDKFVFISTDKAVDPICIYGATKLAGEHLCLAHARNSSNRMNPLIVRFGNVLGSRGSILPLFQRQIQYGGPVTVTHPDATRYFMTIPEACSLVLKTAHTGVRGASYLLDMGTPVRILELAENVIRFYGYEPYRDIPIEITGLRPGEKVHESLVAEGESFEPTSYDRISLLTRHYECADVEGFLRDLEPVFDPESPHYRDRAHLYDTVKQYFPTVEDSQHV